MTSSGDRKKVKYHLRHYQVNQSSKWMIWGGMTGLTDLHFIPQGQTVTADYYMTQILEKEVKPPLCRKSSNEIAVKRKIFSSNRNMTFVQDGGTTSHS